jgi:hypothetical protein
MYDQYDPGQAGVPSDQELVESPRDLGGQDLTGLISLAGAVVGELGAIGEFQLAGISAPAQRLQMQ